MESKKSESFRQKRDSWHVCSYLVDIDDTNNTLATLLVDRHVLRLGGGYVGVALRLGPQHRLHLLVPPAGGGARPHAETAPLRQVHPLLPLPRQPPPRDQPPAPGAVLRRDHLRIPGAHLPPALLPGNTLVTHCPLLDVLVAVLHGSI